VLQFEAIEATAVRPASRPTRRPPLPLHVEPAPEEALFSWLLRLATRLGVSLHVLARESFGIDDRSGRTHWWCRPHPWVLARISERTGVGVARLRRMTFEGFEPVYRDDEASARFAGRRYDTIAPQWRAYRFAVCGQCLEADAKPYLRTPWLIGWMALCPHHGTILIERCKACHASLRVAPFATAASFSPTTCTRCAESLLGGCYSPAHPSVARMQAALLRGKCEGITELDGLGRLTWKEMVALADVLIGMVWTGLTLAEQEQIFLSYTSDPLNEPRGEDGIYDRRHGSLQFLAWLTEGWPDGPGAKVGQSMLIRWMTADGNRGMLIDWLTANRNRLCRHLRPPWADHWSAGPNNFEPPIQQRLRALAGAP
jgi:hypothetical protein